MGFLTRLFSGILFFLASTSAGIAAEWQMPPTVIDPGDANFRLSEADNNGHVMLLSLSGNTDLYAYYYTNGTWTLSDVLLTSPSVGSFDVAMDPSGTALAVFGDDNTNTLNSRYFDGSGWSTPTPNPLDTTSPNLRVAMNGPGQGVAIWATGTGMAASFFSSGTWTTPQIIGGSNNLAFFDLAYSANGTVAVVWFDLVAGDYYVTNFNGLIWQAPQVLSPLSNFNSIGIDAIGNAYIGGDGIRIIHFNANTSTIVSSQIISTSPTTDNPSIAVAPNGTAVATWVDTSNQGLSSVYNGVSWSPEFPFSFGADQLVFSQDVSVDTNGNALVVWATSDGSVRASRMALGTGVWSVPSELVAPTATGDPNNIASALSANGIGFAAWAQEVGEFEFSLMANASILAVIPITPPFISGTTCSNNFAMQSDIVNIITITPSTTPGVVSYYLRRDGVLIAIIPASGPFIYYDHNRDKNRTYTYSVTAVDAFGAESMPAILVMRG